MIEPLQVVELAAVLFIASILQGAVGFAAGVFGIPVLIWLGWTLPEASAIIVASTSVQNLWGFLRYRGTLNLREMWLPTVIRVACIPLGVAVLWWLSEHHTERIKQVVGGVMLMLTIMVALIKPHPHRHLSPIWTWIVFPFSGFLQGLVGMGGPPMVLWVQSHDWSTERSRAYLFAIYLVSLPVSLLLLMQVFGAGVGRAVLLTLALLPVVLVATAIGLRLGSALGRQRMRWITIAILIVLALYNLLAPMIG